MRRVLLAAAAALALCGAAGAQDAQDYKASYQAFVAARAAGDADAARAHAVAAWEAGRTALPPGETLALLTQNALLEVLWDDAAAAAPMAAEALALGRAGHGLTNMTLTELDIAQARTAASADGSKAAVAALAAALAADRATGRAPNPFAVTAHDQAFVLAMGVGAHGLAYDLMTPLVAELRGADAPAEAVASRELFRAIALLVAGRRIDSALGRDGAGGRWSQRERIEDAHVLIDHAMLAFPPVKTVAELEASAIDAHVWHGVVTSLASPFDVNLREEHRFDGLAANPGGDDALLDRPEGYAESCEMPWTNRRITYPRLRDFYVGGVLIGYDLSAEGRVENARVLGEVPSGRFGPHVLRQVEKWKADVDGLPASCLRDHVARIIFTTP